MTTKTRAHAIAIATEDAYSFNRYGRANWRKAAIALAERGLDAQQIEAVLRSKWTRWAADAAGKTDGATATDLLNWIEASGGFRKDVEHLTMESLPVNTKRLPAAERGLRNEPAPTLTGADLAGDCTGEDIADLIDLARQVADVAHSFELGPKATAILARIERRVK